MLSVKNRFFLQKKSIANKSIRTNNQRKNQEKILSIINMININKTLYLIFYK